MTAAVLLAGLAASAALAQDTDGDLHSAAPKQKAFWDGWFAAPAKPDEKKPTGVAPPAAPPMAPSGPEPAALVHSRERAAWNRRMEVCDRLMEIAVQNNDDAMQSQIEQLRDRAWELYQQRTAKLPVSGPSSPDEAALDRRLGIRSSGRLLAGFGGGARSDGGQASVTREVKP